MILIPINICVSLNYCGSSACIKFESKIFEVESGQAELYVPPCVEIDTENNKIEVKGESK